VKAHVSAILRRLALDNRVQAAILAHEAGLVERG
jgi:DNA-binding NarL/FixJ family response regulator